MRLLTAREVGALLQVRPEFVYRLCKRQREPLPHVVLGPRCLRFQLSEVEAWIQRQKENRNE